MAKKNSLKKALITSALSMVLCSSMLVGTTYAWFTDSVTSTGNVIQTGTLKVAMTWAEDPNAATWTDASKGPIFSYEDWEPGYTEVKYVKIANVGTLDLKFVLNIVPNKAAEEVNLADVIEVYMLDEAVTERDALTAEYYVGTLASLMKDEDGAAHGVLYADDEDAAGNVDEIYTIVLKMSESAGNDYMGKSVGGGFSVQLLATQLASEKDSLGNDYDEGLDPATNYVATAAQLQAALRKGGKIVLMDDISLDAGAEFMATNGNGSLLDLKNVNVTLDLNGHDIVAEADALMDGKTAATALFLVHNSTFNIVGEGNIITKNQAIPVYGWLKSEINIYGGTFKGNGYERNESDVYVNNDTVTINVYGGDFTESIYAFNAHDTSANDHVIVLHEGVTFKNFLKNGTTDVIASDINAGRIVPAEGMYLLKIDEKDGETVYEVAKKQENVNYVSNFGELTAALEKGGNIKLTANISVPESLNIPKDTSIYIYGQGYTISRGKEYTGTVFTANQKATLTLENIIVDGGAVWSGAIDPTLQRGTTNTGVTATGNLIATEANSSIVLNEGAILQNNVGVYAVNLGTRIGATLTVNGGQIINNESEAGAIWGGGNIVINDGSKINGNSSTSLAGVIRMVSGCDLTVNGGEINHNKAAGDGGVIWGYGSSTYTFTGGEMAYNESAGTGGAIYTGTYSVINISGDFEMHDNKAADSGAIRLTDHTSLTMTGGKIYNNTQNGVSNAFNTWNNPMLITGGSISDDISYVGGVGLTIGEADIDGVISYNLSTTHNTAYLAAEFNGFKFTVNEEAANFSDFNFKPADGYKYTEGDEAKLVCLNEGYSTYWDATTGTFRLKAN